MNRREFLKVAGVTTAATGAALAVNPKKVMASVELGKYQDDYPYEVTKDFKGFSSKNVMFMRMFWDNNRYKDEYLNSAYDYHTPIETGINFYAGFKGYLPSTAHDPNTVGFRSVDKALGNAADSVNIDFGGMSKFTCTNSIFETYPINPQTGKPMKDMPVLTKGLFTWDNSSVDKMIKQGKSPYKFEDAKDAAKYVKKAAKFLGADLVGIAPYNERTKRWTYKEWTTPNVKEFNMPDGSKTFSPVNPIKLQNGEFETYGVTTRKSDFMREAGFEPKSIIVMAFKQDYDSIKTAPTAVSTGATGMAYSQMAETSYKLAKFLKEMGYKAAQAGNDTALSVPLAVEAGFGEGSRMGMLVTEQFGPSVRLAKVYTNLEIHPDKPKTFGVKEFCDVCMKCADACPGKSISKEPITVVKEGMEFDTGIAGKSNISGVEKWFVNGERCLSFWNYNGGGCTTCVAVCPYNKIDEWHHDLSKLMTLSPFKPLLRSMDELFGYGGPVEPEVRLESKYLKDAVNDFWDKL